MTAEEMKALIEQLNRIIQIPIAFDGLICTVSYADRAGHSKHWVVQRHYHPWFEFNYVMKGSFYTRVEESEFLVQEGQSFLIAPGVVHAHRHNHTGDDGLCIRFRLEAENSEEVHPIYQEMNRCRAFPFVSGIEDMPRSDGRYGAEAAFITWLMRLYDQWSGINQEEPVKNSGISAQVELYLKEYYKTKIQVEDIANALNISYRSLARQFKAETGMTISDRLTALRLCAAKQLLSESTMPLYDIASAVGYENEFYFSNIFKKNEGVAPSKYRNQQKSDAEAE